MKRFLKQYAGRGIGLMLILAGLIWACQKMTSPGQLSASSPKSSVALMFQQVQPQASVKAPMPKPLPAAEEPPIQFTVSDAEAGNAAGGTAPTDELYLSDSQPASSSREENEADSVPLPSPKTIARLTEPAVLEYSNPSASAKSAPAMSTSAKSASTKSASAQKGTAGSASAQSLPAPAVKTAQAENQPAAPLPDSRLLPVLSLSADSSPDDLLSAPDTFPADSVQRTNPPTPNLPAPNSPAASAPAAVPQTAAPQMTAPPALEIPGADLPDISFSADSPAAGTPLSNPAAGNLPAANPAANPAVENRPNSDLQFPQMSGFPQDVPSAESLSGPSPDSSLLVSAGENRTAALNYSYSTSSRPGDPALDGEQKAEISLEKELPEEIQVGQEAEFKIIVKNNGKKVAQNVALCDRVPEGTRLTATEPVIGVSEDGTLLWPGFDFQPGEERTFTYRLIPETEGEIGSVATVSIQSSVSGRTRCTRPLLQLAVDAPNQTLIGETFRLNIQISNPGTGIARNVTLREEVPEGLLHQSGKILENPIGDLAPGEKKTIALTLQAVAAGQAINWLSVSGDGNLLEKVENTIEIQAPELALEINGPKLRYLEREAVYSLKVWNPGSVTAQNLKLSAELPPQMKFVRTNNEGVYQESNHTVYWELAELPNHIAPGDIELVLLPTETGSGQLKFHAQGEMNLSADTSHDITIDGFPALSFSVVSLSDPVEAGQNAEYEIHIVNRGTKASNNVRIAVALPEEMEAVHVEGPTRSSTEPAGVAFAPLSSLGAKEEQVYKMVIRCPIPGDHRIRVRVSSDDMEPLIKEESVRIYGVN